jgi:hypothetical protein
VGDQSGKRVGQQAQHADGLRVRRTTVAHHERVHAEHATVARGQRAERVELTGSDPAMPQVVVFARDDVQTVQRGELEPIVPNCATDHLRVLVDHEGAERELAALQLSELVVDRRVDERHPEGGEIVIAEDLAHQPVRAALLGARADGETFELR